MENLFQFFTDNFWATAIAVGTLVSFVTSIFTNYFNPNKIWKQVISWALSVGCTVGCYFGGMINVAEPTWLSLCLTGLVVGLSSNGIYSIEQMKAYINGFGAYVANIFKK